MKTGFSLCSISHKENPVLTLYRIAVRTEFMQWFKSAILTIFHFWQNETFEPLTEIQTLFLPKAFFWSIMKVSLIKHFQKMSRVHQIYDVSQSTKRGFSKKVLSGLERFLFILGSYESLKRLGGYIRSDRSFLPSINPCTGSLHTHPHPSSQLWLSCGACCSALSQ